MTFDVNFISAARKDLSEHVQPRDETERAIVNALGECSWDECVTAIQKYRAEQDSASPSQEKL
jgi:hypothetical protein